MNFTLDKTLEENFIKILETDISIILIAKNSSIPWYIIVPFTDEIEWFLLEENLQIQLNHQVNILSKFLKNSLSADKINIATIGNIVSQMHIHVVGRKKNDLFWPDVIWGKSDFKPYDKNELTKLIELTQKNLKNSY